MKRKIAVMICSVLTASAMLSGCQASKGLENEYLKITQYKEVEISEVTAPEEVTDDDVDYAIQANLQAQPLTDKNLKVKNGDTAIIDYVGKMDGEAFDGGSAEGAALEIGSNTFIDGFEESIIDHNIGDTFDWNGKFPDDYGSEDLAGKDVVFTITVNGIAPELDDEFVKSVSETSKTVDEYKNEIKEQLTKSREETYQTSINESAWNEVIANTEVKKYPEDQVSEKTETLISQYQSVAESSGVEYEEYIEQQTGMSTDEFKTQLEEVIKENLKQTMVSEAIAEKEKISLTDEEYEKKLEELVERYGFEDVDEIKALVPDEDDLKEMIINEMVMEWVGEHCIQVADN